MEWQRLTPDNLPKQGAWILISDGTDWRRVLVTNQYEFVEHPDDMMCYFGDITHWCEVSLPSDENTAQTPSFKDVPKKESNEGVFFKQNWHF